MSKVASLQQYKQDKRFESLVKNVSEWRDLALIEFEGLVQSGKVNGGWDDHLWTYQNRSIWFSELRDVDGQIVNSKTMIDQRVALTGIWAELIRLYALGRIKRGTSGKAVSGNTIAVAYLFDALRYDATELLKLKQPSVCKAHDLMLSEAVAPTTAFEKYKIVVAFVRDTLVANKLCPNFKPRVDIPNPRLAQVDTTKKEYVERRAKKYEEGIDRYIALARRRWDTDQARIAQGEEPLYPATKPLYDELRFLAIPFLMAFGLRVGELCRLTYDCLQYDEINERWYLNVYTEKGQLPSARPLPRMWEKVVRDAHARVMNLTESTRQFSQKIEHQGKKAFIDLLTFPERPDFVRESLLENGFDPELYFYRSEIGVQGDIHPSGLPYNSLRRGHPYFEAQVGSEVVGRTGPKKNRQVVISIDAVASIAHHEFINYQQSVFQENLIDEGELGTYSSDSFAAEVPFSKHLFLATEETFSLAHGHAHGLVPKPMTARNIGRWLANDGSRSSSLFERFDIRDEDSKVVDINSHQFRHWLTTAIIRSGKNEMMVDLFMGRSPGQTRNYDHRTAKERAEGLRKKYLSNNVPDDALGRRVKRMRDNDASLDVIESAVMQTLQVAHFTPWGLCWRDLDVNPCEKGMMCMRGEDGKGCGHFGIDPTDEEARQSIYNTKIHYENQLSILLPNYDELRHELNRAEPLDQHIQFCIETLDGCESALRAYDNYAAHEKRDTNVVRLFSVEEA